MTGRRLKIGLIFAAVLVLLGMALLASSLQAKLFAAAYDDSAWQARQFAQGLQNDVKLKAREVEARAVAGASLNSVRALVTYRADRATLEDVFRNEDWWRSFREEFPVQLLASQRETLNFSRDPVELEVDGVFAAAKLKSPVSQVVIANGKPYFVAATSVDVPVDSHGGPTFLVLGRPFLAKDLSADYGDKSAAMLSYAGRTLLSAGASEQLRHLEEVDQKDPRQSIVAPEAQWSVAAVELAPNLWLWASIDTSAKSREVSHTVKMVLTPLWGIAALLSVSCLYLAFRRRGTVARGDSGRQERGPQQREPVEGPALEETALALRGNYPTRPRAVPRLPTGNPQAPLLSSVPSGPHHPNQFGRYRLIHALGKGSTMRTDLAVLYGAEGFHRLFVIKRLLPDLAGQPSAVEEFVKRAQLGSALVHSNIVPIYDLGRVGDEYFIAQEHIFGRDLRSVVLGERQKHGELLPGALVFYVTQEIAKALAYAHTLKTPTGEPAGVIHGNISPHKILVSAMGEVKLLDFGIPHTAETLAEATSDRAQFMSPEQARGEAIDERSDLFSLALTMFWCLTGRPLYAAPPGRELLEKAGEGLGREEHDLINSLAGSATGLLQRALEPAPDNRFQTAEEFARAIPPWQMTRAEDRLQSIMRRLFERDFEEEQGRYADCLSGLEDLTISELEPESEPDRPVDAIGRMRQS